MELHKMAGLFPGMTVADYNNLKRSIELIGQQETIKLWQGAIIDGRHRLKACHELGLDLRFEEFAGTEAEAVSYVLALNLHRRQLTDGQRGMIAARVADYRRENNLIQAPKVQNAPSGASEQNQQLSGITQKAAAALLNVSPDSVKRAAAVHKHGVIEVVEPAEQGAVSVVAAEQIAHLDKETQRAVLKDIVAGKPIGQTIAAAKQATAKEAKPAPSVPKHKATATTAPVAVTPTQVLTFWGYALSNAENALTQTQRAVSASADEWRKFLETLHTLARLVDAACDFAMTRIEEIEDEVAEDWVISDQPASIDDVPLESAAPDFGFNAASNPSPYADDWDN